MEHVKLDSDYCPTCGAECNAATPADGEMAQPQPMDISICFYCSEALQFDNDLKLEVIRMEDFMALEDDVRNEVVRVKRFIQEELKRKEEKERKNETNTTTHTTNGKDILHE